MSVLSVIKNSEKTFDFETNPVEEMSLETLKQTHEEHDVCGNPIKGMFHYQVIERVTELCGKYCLRYEVETIFAAQNKNKAQPGVVILPQVEKTHGEKAVEAHIIRRVFTTIQIKDGETDELTTTIAIAFHQDGIQLAIGPLVKICHNQCILSPERIVSNYGKAKVSTEDLFTTLDEWLKSFHGQMEMDRERIERMKEKKMSADDLFKLIGQLQTLRVAHDCKDKDISSQVKSYPLNQGQISIFTEDLLKLQQQCKLIGKEISIWEVYNIATNIYKPRRTDIPVIISQNAAFVDMLGYYWGV